MANVSIVDVVDQLENALKRSGVTFFKISWPKFYTINGIERLKDSRSHTLHSEAISRGIAIGYGKHAVFVAFDDRTNLSDNLL